MFARAGSSNLRFSFFIFHFSILLPLTASFCPAAPNLTLTTSHYRIHTDLDPALAMDVSRRMDAMFDEYDRRFAPIADLTRAAPTDVYLFRWRSDYLDFVGAKFAHTGGLFIPDQNRLVASLEGQGRDGLRRTLQHEAFHQFAQLALGPNLPPWLNEGLAQLFEESLWTGDHFLLYQVPPRRVRQVQSELLAHRWMNLRDLVQLTPRQWAQPLAGDPSAALSRYNQSWALVHFLAHERDENGRPCLPRLLALLQAIRDHRDATAAFFDIFPDLKEIESHFNAFAQNLDATPEALLVERQQVLADMIIELSLSEPLPADTSALLRRLRRDHYQLRYSAGEMHWTSDPDVAVYFADWNGKLLGKGRLEFASASISPLPQIICRPSPHLELQTSFHRSTAGKPEHETILTTQ